MSNRDLVVIGGSAGAMQPLKLILRALPTDFPTAVLVVLHVPSDSTGVFTTVAGAAASLPVSMRATANRSSAARSIWRRLIGICWRSTAF